MKERPILFSDAMVLAILDGTKTQTRRVIKDQERFASYEEKTLEDGCFIISFAGYVGGGGEACARSMLAERYCPYGQPGDRLWVREGLRREPRDIWAYRADSCLIRPDEKDRGAAIVWAHHKESDHCSSIHMPRWACRIHLEVTDVRVERVQDISEDDAIAEGLAKITKDDGRTWKYGIPDRDGLPGGDDLGWQWIDWSVDPRRAFSMLWDGINFTRPGCSWDENPWVWRITFRKLDEAERRAAA
jgi:hypothetical protein